MMRREMIADMGSFTPHLEPVVSREELVAALGAGRTVLVDVLSPESYAVSHIDGAINLPVAEIVSRASAVLPNRHTPIIVYCGGPT
jgi:rhodanese-related sulfurtransferase